MKIKMKNFKKESGITLVALIITIIVLLILAMVSIRLVMNGGIIGKAENTTKTYSDEEIGEQLKLAYAEYQMSQYTGTPVNIQAKLQEIYGQDTTAELKNGKLKATINGKVYQYDVNSGKSGEYVDPINYGTKTKETIAPGDDITIGGTEKFKVFSVSNSEIKAMPYYNLKLDSNPMRQATEEEADSAGTRSFSESVYWIQGEDEIDMSDSRNNIQQYIDKYKITLVNMGVEKLTVRVAKNSELSVSGITNDMRNPGKKGGFWIGSCPSYTSENMYDIESGGYIGNTGFNINQYGVRAIIIIQK